MLGRISGVGAFSVKENGRGVGVADGGNQIRVAVGSGVDVGTTGVEVMSKLSREEHDINNVIIKSQRNER